MEANMFEATGKGNTRATEYANARDFCRIFAKDMNSLYLLALLLTGDHEKAQHSFVAGLEDATHRNTVFKEWARSWARRVIVQNALFAVKPRIGGENTPDLTGSQSGDENPEIRGVLKMQPFDRFVFVLSVLEGYSDHECAILLECTRRDVLAARTRAFEHIGRAAELHDVEKSNSRAAQAEFRRALYPAACAQVAG
jgi:DNA-directed RNA polymerase specialized sigma24 family protein